MGMSPLVGKQLLDLLLVLSNYLTTSSFKHHKPDVFGRSRYENLDFGKGTIKESESDAVEPFPASNAISLMFGSVKVIGSDCQTLHLVLDGPWSIAPTNAAMLKTSEMLRPSSQNCGKRALQRYGV